MVRPVLDLLRHRDGLTQILVVLAVVGVYELARIAIEPDWAAALANAQRIVEVERVLLLGWEEPLQDAFLALPGLVRAMNVFYFVGHFLLTAIFFLWLYHRSRDGFRSFRDGFIVATLIALVIHWQFPTAPPRLAGVGLIDTLRLFSGIDIGSPRSTALSNPVFAVPSLHAGYAAGVGYGLVRYARLRWLRLLGAAYPAAVVLTIIVTGNHFVVDALAGIAVLALGFAVAARLRRGGPRAILAVAPRGGAVR